MGDKPKAPRRADARPGPAEPREGDAARDEPTKHQRELFGQPAPKRTGGDSSDPGESGTGRGSSLPPGRDDDDPPHESPG